MVVRIMIKRRVPQDKLLPLSDLLKRMRALCLHQPGYVSGETLRMVDDPSVSLVISTWRSLEDWKVWFNNHQREEVQHAIDMLLGEPSHYEVYH